MATVSKTSAQSQVVGAQELPLPQDFETALAELESLVSEMESGSFSLEQSLGAYKRGVELTRVCQERLTQAEQQVKVLEAGLLRPMDDADKA